MAFIELHHVNKYYGQFQVLSDCTLSVEKEEVVVICGPSGSGKSTLIKTINGLEPIQSGKIVVDGLSLQDSNTNLSLLRSKVGMVFQSFELFPHLSVTDNLTIAQIKVLKRSPLEAKKHGLMYLEPFVWIQRLCCLMNLLLPLIRRWLAKFSMSWCNWLTRE
jgi:glutamate/aspartate transport system ATP-binding protein